MSAFFTAITAAALTFGQPQTADVRPALWAVHDADTTIYLFGTFHALDGHADWFRDDVRAAFSISDELVLETLIPELEQAPPLAPVRSNAASPNFLGATRMAVSAGKDRGLDVHKGADMVLLRAADDIGKPVAGLETIQFQIGMLARMSGPRTGSGSPVAMNAAAQQRMASIMGDMQSAWEQGDQRLFTAMLGQMRYSTPHHYRTMFPERNARWADWIVDRMAHPGVVFVAVGAAHFAGPDSVLANLQAQGLPATRLN